LAERGRVSLQIKIGAFILAGLGVFLAITIAESLLAVVGVLVFRRGRWKERVV